MSMKTQVLISNKHVHLNREALDALFGKGYELTVKKHWIRQSLQQMKR